MALTEKFEVKTIDYFPGRKWGSASQKKYDKLIAEGWELVSQTNRLGALTNATLRRTEP